MTWTPADKPPEADVTVLVFIPDPLRGTRLGYHDGKTWRDDKGVDIEEVISHWQPIPEPPEDKR